MSIDKRSILAKDYAPFFRPQYSYLHKEIEARKRMIEEGHNRPKKRVVLEIEEEKPN